MDSASTGLQTALNAMREASIKDGRIYHQYVPVVTDTTTIGDFGTPILDHQNTAVLNDFIVLLKKVVYTAVNTKLFNNPLSQLEGERLPLGQFIENAYVNPAKARQFNGNDFIGLLQKYEAEVAVEYLSVNSDLQYQVTITRDKIRNAFTSWRNLEEMITGLINSLYNGAYIDHYRMTKDLVTGAYSANKLPAILVTNPTDEATAKQMITQVRATFSKMKVPSTNYNAWNKINAGDETKPVLKTWSDPEDIVVMISADVDALTSVEVLARAFNMDETKFMGRVIVVDDFNIYNEDGSVAVDGSHIKAFVADRAFFKIREQDFDMSDFWNPHNRSWQYYLNDVRMYNYSLFANGVIFADELPEIPATAVEAPATLTVTAGGKVTYKVKMTPTTATSTLTVASSAEGKATATISGNTVTVTGVEAGSADITVTAEDGVTAVTAVTVESA